MKSKEHLMEVVSKGCKERRQYLTDFFKHVPNAVAEEFRYAEIKENEKIISVGEPCDVVYIVLEGDVKGVDYYKTGVAYSFMDFSEMFILGEYELFSGEKEHLVSVYADTDCKVLKISANRYLNWIQHDENALFLRLKNILQTLPKERKREREYLRMGCRERVISYLVHFYEKNIKTVSKNGAVKIRLTQAELSEKVGFNIRSVQRVIASLEAAKMVSIESGKMVLSYEQYLKLSDEIE